MSSSLAWFPKRGEEKLVYNEDMVAGGVYLRSKGLEGRGTVQILTPEPIPNFHPTYLSECEDNLEEEMPPNSFVLPENGRSTT